MAGAALALNAAVRVVCAGEGTELRLKGLNRIGNMLVPNSNYCKFEDWIMPILDQMLKAGRRALRAGLRQGRGQLV
jgi:deoxyhypusine synthase